MKILISFLIFLISSFTLYSQIGKTENNFKTPIRHSLGDLNNNGIMDSVSISMDIIHETRPLKLEVFFGQANRDYKLEVSSIQIIEAQYPVNKNGEHNGRQIPYFEINNGILEMISDIQGGQSVHQFKYQKGSFELIHFFKVVWDGKNTTTETEIDLITGKYLQYSQFLGSEGYFDRIEKDLNFDKLPKLEDFVPFQNEFY